MGKDTIPTDIGHYFHHKKSKPLLDGCFQLHIPPGRNMQVTVVFKSYGFTRHSASVQYHGLGTLRYKTLTSEFDQGAFHQQEETPSAVQTWEMQCTG